MTDYYKLAYVEGRQNAVFYFDDLNSVYRFNNDILNAIPKSSSEYQIAEPYIDDIEKRVAEYARSEGITWYGTKDTSWAGKPINQYAKSAEMFTAFQSLSQSTLNVDIVDIDQKKTINFNDRELGIFSFDLASLGLYPVYEYYSNLLKRTVDPNFVESYENEKGERIFYFVGLPFVPKHEVQYDFDFAGYYSKILGRVVSKNEIVEQIPTDPKDEITYFFPERAEIPKHDVQQIQSVDESGNPKFSSTFKKSFIQIEKVYKRVPRIDIIVPVSYSATIKSEEMFWNSIAVAAVAQKLSDSNVDYRIIASNTASTINGGKNNFAFIELKNDQQPLDINQLGLVVSDARVFRTDFFRLDYAMQYRAGYGAYFSSSIGRPINDVQLIKRMYMGYLAQSTNESDIEASTMPQSKIVFPQALSRQAAINSYNKVVGDVSNLIS